MEQSKSIQKVNKSFEYEDEKLKKRQELLEEVYTERFGTKEERNGPFLFCLRREKSRYDIHCRFV